MTPRFTKLPASLAEKSRTIALPGPREPIPALLCHPDWVGPAPTVIWLHGRTAYKELDSGRFLRLIRAGIAAVAIDLPGHGDRPDQRGDVAALSLDLLAETIAEIDVVVEALADPVYQGVFDLDRLAIGGMSMGGMATLRRLCDAHDFRCAVVESSSGDLAGLYDEASGSRPWGVAYPAAKIAPLDARQHLSTFKPIPLLALHSEADRIVPWSIQHGFLDRLRAHYRERGADPDLVQWHTWSVTGAPEEHSGFGKVAAEAKSVLIDFFSKWLPPTHR